MEFCDFRGELSKNEYEIDRVGSRNWRGLDFLQGIGLRSVFGSTFQDRLQPGGILELFV